MAASNERRIVIVGKTGIGKSSLANTLFRVNLFMTDDTFDSGTKICQKESKLINGKKITLIDTPGLFDTRYSEEVMKKELLGCIAECAPGPHVILIVLKVERFTKHEQAVSRIREYFSEEAFKYAAVLFTHGDLLPRNQTIEDLVQRNKAVSDLVEKCGGRCHVIDNKHWKDTDDEYRNNQVQVKKLLNTIDKMMTDNSGRCFTNEMLQRVEENIQQVLTSNERRIVIVGKTGTGKSSLANTLFGGNLFMTDGTFDSGTKICQKETKPIDGKNITLIDTPGLFDTDGQEEEVKAELLRSITECSPGPHVFLIVLKLERFTKQEEEVIKRIREYFSDEALKYAVVLFTHGDQLPENKTIEDLVQMNKAVSDLVEKCGGRCHVIDNKYWRENQKDKYRNNQVQVKKLLNTIDKMMTDNSGSCFTNKILQRVEKNIQQEETRIRILSAHMTVIEIREKAKANVFQKLWKKIKIGVDMLLGMFLGGKRTADLALDF